MLLARADSALYEAKRTGRDRLAWAPQAATFTPALDPADPGTRT